VAGRDREYNDRGRASSTYDIASGPSGIFGQRDLLTSRISWKLKTRLIEFPIAMVSMVIVLGGEDDIRLRSDV